MRKKDIRAVNHVDVNFHLLDSIVNVETEETTQGQSASGERERDCGAKAVPRPPDRSGHQSLMAEDTHGCLGGGTGGAGTQRSSLCHGREAGHKMVSEPQRGTDSLDLRSVFMFDHNGRSAPSGEEEQDYHTRRSTL
ncbi:unnamed protein product [Boreogadus saida]